MEAGACWTLMEVSLRAFDKAVDVSSIMQDYAACDARPTLLHKNTDFVRAQHRRGGS